eukprot:TRINITY_DN3570_c0_g1_i1.p1 TRINITY_DN3570_c0_g1~~TRINITY_DN3570_c0_g1_i1.p1  ORF type:complete len:339 (+),score=57.99 TRINITY_DN3570_c0_g1_i1:32-1048(+)
MAEADIKQQLTKFDLIVRQFRVADASTLKNHFKKLLSFSPSYKVFLGGNPQHILFSGTMPITIQGNRFNLPSEFWIPNNYPQSRPACFFLPNQSIELVPNHRNVDANGKCVNIPYLDNWTKNSNLLDLMKKLSALFSENTPMVSRTIRSTPLSSSAKILPPQPQSQSKPQSLSQSLQQPPTKQISTAEAYRNVINENLHQKYRNTIQEVQALELRMHSLGSETKDLAMKGEELRQIDTEIERIEKELEEKEMWYAINQSNDYCFDVDQYTIPKDPLEAQKINIMSEELAQNDAIYKLQSFLSSGKIDLDTFLKTVRSISRDQFFKVALYNKCNEARVL